MTSDKILIKIKNVSKTFQIPKERKTQLKHYFLNPFHKPESVQFHALKNISFEVKKGEFLGIIGRNGSGKSTLLKLIAGIYQPDKGEIKVRGKVTPFLELGVGFNPELSARENIFLNGTILGMTRKYLEEKFDEIVDFAEVREFVDMPVKNYSSGMQVRLAFAIAIQSDADIYLVDEVLAVGDAGFQEKCFDVFRRFKKDGKTIVFVSHGMDSVQKFCDKAIWIDNGFRKYIGTAQKAIYKYSVYDSDQETPIINTSNNDSPEIEDDRWGTGAIRITSAQLIDYNNKAEKYFTENDKEICLLVNCEAKKSVKNVNLGVAIFNDDTDSYIYGSNTNIDGYKLNIKKGESFQFTYKFKNILLTGKYSLQIGIFSDGVRKTHDFINHRNKFRISRRNQKELGLVRLEHKWKIQ